jgi:hypothetical protein
MVNSCPDSTRKAVALTKSVGNDLYLQVIRCLVHLVCNFFNHYPLQITAFSRHASNKIMHTHATHSAFIPFCSNPSAHLRFDLGVHVEGNVLQASHALPDLIELRIQFSDQKFRKGTLRVKTKE